MIMGTHTVMTHALTNGTRAVYSGTQDWGPATVTVVKPWGGLSHPLYVVTPDGTRSSYVVAQSELSPVVSDTEWLATPSVLASGVSLAKSGDAPAPVAPMPTGDVALTGADGSWVTYESRAVVEGWRADSIRVGAYAMAAGWGMVLRGEA
jgi:hypothetical protein